MPTFLVTPIPHTPNHPHDKIKQNAASLQETSLSDTTMYNSIQTRTPTYASWLQQCKTTVILGTGKKPRRVVPNYNVPSLQEGKRMCQDGLYASRALCKGSLVALLTQERS
ncbi:hypothetical protein E2C01_099027 [Portunus trituberculatus]|uniref:Uncharacterized protein n=1 Tax=Portunus trituberculatus TaxID=210409 RepID=A0A5B7K8H7_PORTR|nr:hypothetical protein [Portunus trituberculatus]